MYLCICVNAYSVGVICIYVTCYVGVIMALLKSFIGFKQSNFLLKMNQKKKKKTHWVVIAPPFSGVNAYMLNTKARC